MTLFCKTFGHDLGPAAPVYTSMKDTNEFYNAFICKRCDVRIPASDEDAIKQTANSAKISALMNANRRRLGLRPVSWGN